MARCRHREPETAAIGPVTHDGRGIAAVEGKKVFVDGALPGETVRFLRRKSRRRFDEAELLEVVTPSPDRIEPHCAVFGRCGGCALQHTDPERQRAIKQQVLEDNLQRIGNVEPREWLEPLAGPVWHYRRRARLAVKDVHAKGRVLVGFRERHAPYVTDMHRCEVLVEPVATLLDALSDVVAALSIRARLPQIEVAVADNGAALVFRVLDPPSAADIEALCAFGAAHRVRVYLQPGGPDSIECIHPAGEVEALYYSLPEYELQIAFEPTGFVQVNAEINRRMVHRAMALLDPQPDDRVLDLYCGIGNFTLPVARLAGEVVGVEGDAGLVAAAARNAERNSLGNASFRVADLDAIDESTRWLHQRCDRLLLDPARSGAARVVERIDAPAPARIVYVSCHPGTLARDAAVLVHDKGYRCDSAGIIDMFPHTAHIESIAVFSK